jgi:transcriptional regulator with XRE-family HTH domain
MAKKFRDLIAKVEADPVRRQRMEEYRKATDTALALADLRKSRGATQQDVANGLSTSQANISQIEHQGDIYLSTLDRYVRALGGRLEIAAVFPDQTVALRTPQDESVPELV